MQITIMTYAGVLQDITATGGIFDPAATAIGLYSAVTNNGLNTLLADVTPCTGALATTKVIGAWADPAFDESGNLVCVGTGTTMNWATAAGGDAQAVAGYYWVNTGTGTPLLGFTAINPPASIPYPYGQVTILPVLQLLESGINDVSSVVIG